MFDFKQKYWKWLIPLLCGVYCLFEIEGKGDFYIFLSAADDLDGQTDIFSKKYVDGYHYYYSVLFATLLKPFVSLPYSLIKYSWILFNSLLFFDLLRMLYRSEMVSKLNNKQQNVFIFLVFVVSLRFFIENIHTAQITILILWCCIRGLYFIIGNKPITGSAILAVGINIKLLPLVFIPYLIYRSYFKEAFYVVLFYFFFLFAPSLFVGHDYNMSLISTWLDAINPSNTIHILDVDERSFHGLSTLLSTLLIKDVPDFYALNIKRNIADVSLDTLSHVILITRLILIMITLYFLRLSFFSKARNTFSICLEVSYMLLLIPLIFPHQQHYAFLFATPAFAIVLLTEMISNKKHTIVIMLLILIYLTFNLKLLLGAFNSYYEHFKILTYSALLLIPLLIYIRNKEIYFSPGSKLT